MTELTRARIEAIKNGAPRIDESEIVALCDLATKALDQADTLSPDLAAIAARNAATGALVTPEQLRYLRAATEYLKSCHTEMDHGGYYSFNHIPTIERLPDEVDRLNAEVARLTAALAEAEKRAARFEEALTASENTKAAYIGEFSFQETEMVREELDGDLGDFVEAPVTRTVPWTTTKEIMAAIKARALSSLPKVGLHQGSESRFRPGNQTKL